MNVRTTLTKLSALTGSTLMVGLTLGSAASLGDFPNQFINNQGNPTAEVVVGSQGSVADVVGAVHIGAALGQSSLRVGQIKDTRSVEVAGGSSWTTDGAVLDSSNDNLYFGDSVDTVRQTLTEDDLDALATTTFQDAAGNSQEVEQYLYVGQQSVGFGTPGDVDEDPFLYVNNPSSVDGSSYLYRLQANFEDGLALSDTSESDNKNDDVLGEDVELFGKSFTISEDSFTPGNEGELILYGSSQEYDLETGESVEFEIDGDMHTLEVRAVTDANTVAFYHNGELKEKTEGSSFTVDGTDVRVSDVILTSEQNSEGLVTFSIGSEEYVLQDGEAIEDGDGEDIDGTYVQLSGDNVGNSDDVSNDVDVSSIEVGVGAVDSDDGYVRAGSMFQDPVFDDVVFRYGGLLPDAAEQDEPDISFSTDGDAFVAVDAATDDGGLSTNFAEFESIVDEGNTVGTGLAHDTNEDIVVVEGAAVSEDDYVVTDAGGFSHMWEVRGIDEDETNGASLSSGDEATIDLRDVVSGSDVKVELDADTAKQVYEGTEVIDGQTYAFELQAGSDPTFKVAWGAGSHGVDTSVDDTFSTGDETTVFPALDLASDGGLAFTEETTNVPGLPSSPSLTEYTGDQNIVSSTTLEGDDFQIFSNISEIRGGKSVEFLLRGTDQGGSGFARSINVTAGGSASLNGTSLTGLNTLNFGSNNLTLRYQNTTQNSQFTIDTLNVTAAGSSGDVQNTVVDRAVSNTDHHTPLSGSVRGISVSSVSKVTTKDIILPSTKTSGEKTITSGTQVEFDSVDSGSDTLAVDGAGYDVTVESDQTLSLSVNSNDVEQASALVIEPEDDSDTEEVYVETPRGEIVTGEGIVLEDGELDVADVSYSGLTRETAELESDSDVTVGYDRFGAYTWFDSDERGETEIYLPDEQSVVGVAFTGAGGSLERSSVGQQQTSFVYRGVKNKRIRGRLPGFALVDEEVSDRQRSNRHLVLVGGPGVNKLVADLAEDHDSVWTQDEWQDRDGGAVLQFVEDAFSEGRNALIVAGHSSDDTVRAARYLGNWREHRSSLRGEILYRVE